MNNASRTKVVVSMETDGVHLFPPTFSPPFSFSSFCLSYFSSAWSTRRRRIVPFVHHFTDFSAASVVYPVRCPLYYFHRTLPSTLVPLRRCIPGWFFDPHALWTFVTFASSYQSTAVTPKRLCDAGQIALSISDACSAVRSIAVDALK